MTPLETFRTETRSWLESAIPASLRGLPMVMPGLAGVQPEPPELGADRARYLKLMVERGFTAPTWPEEYGGAGLSNDEARVLREELERLALAPALAGMGLAMIGPTLLVHGNAAQKQKYLPKIASGEHRWCQGAQFANWIFMLARTDPMQKQQGITFLLVDMQSPGIEVKPIRLISGTSMFCEVFFNDVLAHVSDVVGPVNGGWSVAKTLLNFERSGMGTQTLGGGPRRTASGGQRIVDLAKASAGERAGEIDNPALRDQVAQLLLDELALKLTIQRAADARKSTGNVGPEMSLFKLYQSELGQRRDELTLTLQGSAALTWDGAGPIAPDSAEAQTRLWLSAKATTIYGGSSEIQRNIIAKRILRLPS
jgi:alkylation response protein AidB-like acyl-CoA dehydrogenase